MDKALFQPFYSSSGISTDTRSIRPDCLFVCIKGERFDGNSFATQALEQGAKHVILDNPAHFVNNGTMTLVEDSVAYLQALANYHRRRFTIPVIGITGSNGKTTSKELINAVLSKKYKVLATEGNLNNHLGVPLTLLRMNEQHEIALIEMGANGFKDIEELCAIAEPNFAMITNIGKAHLEGFKSFEGVLKTKKELYDWVGNNGGKIIYNSDDAILKGILPLKKPSIKYGKGIQAEVRGEIIRSAPFVELQWSYGSYSSSAIQTNLVGAYNFYNFLAAAAFGITFEVPEDDISAAVGEYVPTNNRSQVKKTATNTLILDCYNANPTSMSSALDSFATSEHSSKLFILGDMKELGADTEKEHVSILQQVERLALKGYTVGEEFNKLQSPAVLKSFATAQDMQHYLTENSLADYLILLKGSRSIGLEALENSL